MYDNGLLQYYRNLKSNNGFLDVSSIGVTQNYFFTQDKVIQTDIEGKSYYIKSGTPSRPFTKPMCDAEILLSQIYNKAGIQSAVYLPAENEYGSFLISNDVAKPNVVLACSHLIKKLAGNGGVTLPFLAKPEEIRVKPSKIYTKYAMQQQTKMRVLDTASYNYDRHGANFFYKLHHDVNILNAFIARDENECSSPLSITEGGLGNKVQDVVAIDFGMSGGVISRLGKSDLADLFNIYISDFTDFPEPRDKIMDEIKTNENFANLVDKPELAETIGEINPGAVAKDIRETTGYEVDIKMVDVLSRAYDEMADCLLQ